MKKALKEIEKRLNELENQREADNAKRKHDKISSFILLLVAIISAVAAVVSAYQSGKSIDLQYKRELQVEYAMEINYLSSEQPYNSKNVHLPNIYYQIIREITRKNIDYQWELPLELGYTYKDLQNKEYSGMIKLIITPSFCYGYNNEIIDGKNEGGFAPDWIGQFYALFQWVYRLPSREVVRLLPVRFMFEGYPGLHDLDLKVAVKKVGEQRGLEGPE